MARKISLLLIACIIPSIHSECKIDKDFCIGVEELGNKWNGKSFNAKKNETINDVNRKAKEAGTSCVIIVENYSKLNLTNVSYEKIGGNGLHKDYSKMNVPATSKEVMLATVWF